MTELRCLTVRDARPPLFPECFAGQLKRFHGRRGKSAKKSQPLCRAGCAGCCAAPGAIAGNAETILALTRRCHWKAVAGGERQVVTLLIVDARVVP